MNYDDGDASFAFYGALVMFSFWETIFLWQKAISKRPLQKQKVITYSFKFNLSKAATNNYNPQIFLDLYPYTYL